MYGTDKEKITDAAKRMERIMRLRGVSGYFVIAKGEESSEHITLGDNQMIQPEMDNDSIGFIINLNPKLITREQAVYKIREIGEIGSSANRIQIGIKKFAGHFEKILKAKLS